jgi:dephospho-CoA kinase
MIVVGVAGQTGCGKSRVARVFAELGATVLSGDEIGREVVEGDSRVVKRLSDVFGDSILDSKGRLRRKRLAQVAFADPEKTDQLNRIVHPALLKKLRRLIREYRRLPGPGVVIVDAALIFDWGLQEELDLVILVDSRCEDQIRRLREQGLTREESLQRIKRQMPKHRQRRLADMVIRNDGTLSDLKRKALRAYKKLLNLVDKQ